MFTRIIHKLPFIAADENKKWPIRTVVKGEKQKETPKEWFTSTKNQEEIKKLLNQIDPNIRKRIALTGEDKIEKFETVDNPPISLNFVITIIESIHANWMEDGKKEEKKVKADATDQAKEKAKERAEAISNLKYTPKTSITATLGGLSNSFQTTKAIAFAKAEARFGMLANLDAASIGLLANRDRASIDLVANLEVPLIARDLSGNRVGVCFGRGHWVKFSGGKGNQIQGDHAYPVQFIMSRLKIYNAKFKIDEKDKRSAIDFHYYETTNFVPMCDVCNREKSGDYLKWLVRNDYYGIDFVNQNFPLNYKTVVPQTKTGHGLGDAMMSFFVISHATKEVLNPKNIIKLKPDYEKLYMEAERKRKEEKTKRKEAESKIKPLKQENKQLKTGYDKLKKKNDKLEKKINKYEENSI